MSKFWDNFNQGLAAGDKLVANYQRAKLGRDIKDINSDNPTQSYSEQSQADINAAYSPEASGAPSNSTWVPNDGSAPQGVDNSKDSTYEAPTDGGGYWQGQDGQKYTPAPSKGVSTKGTYDLGDGKAAVGLDRWTLGDKTQADAFTRPEIQSYHMNKIGDLIEANGDHEKAMQYRSQGTQLEAAGLQINKAKRDEENEVGYAKSVRHAEEASKAVTDVATPIIDKIQRGEMSLHEGIPQILHSYNTAFNNGHTASYDAKTGTIISIVGGRATPVTGPDGKPVVITAEHLNDVLGSLGKQVDAYKDAEYLKYHPNDYMSARTLRQNAEQFGMTNALGNRTLDETTNYHTNAIGAENRKIGVSESELNAKAPLYKAQANYYNNKASSPDHAPNWNPIGVDKDGALVSYDRSTNHVARPDGKPVQDQSLFKKVTGEKALKPFGAAEEKLVNENLMSDPEYLDAQKKGATAKMKELKLQKMEQYGYVDKAEAVSSNENPPEVPSVKTKAGLNLKSLNTQEKVDSALTKGLITREELPAANEAVRLHKESLKKTADNDALMKRQNAIWNQEHGFGTN